MLAHDWPNAIAHVDADCFYASCELLRRPDLRGTPVCVLSSQDACIVAKTYDAKAAGITTGMTVWEARKLMPHATFISADFRYYGQMSDKLFAVLRRYSPAVEESSIDEAYVDMHGLRGFYRKSYQRMADELRARVQQEIGITVSIGIAVNKTLAKMASEYNKPNGSTIVAGKRIQDFLQQVNVRAIPGIGSNRAALLSKCDMHTAADFAAASEAHIRKLLGKAGTDLWHELNGRVRYKVETQTRLPKSVARTASMGQLTQDKVTIHAHLVRHAMRLSKELLEQRYTTRQLTLFLTLKSFERHAAAITLPYATADYFMLMQEVGKALEQLFDPAQIYRACGLVATEIEVRQAGSFDLFQQAEQQREHKHLRLLDTVHDVNQKYGAHALSICATAKSPGQRGGARFGYPLLECS